MTFRWQQSPGMVFVQFLGPPSRRREDVEVVLTSSSIRAGVRGATPACEGTFFAAVKPQARWGFKTGAGGAVSVVLAVEKAQHQPWPSVFAAMTPGGNCGPAEARCVRATYSYQATEQFELSMVEGDVIAVVAEDPSGWWKGELNGVVGVFPSNFSEPVDVTDDSFDVDDPADVVTVGPKGGGMGGPFLGGVGLGAAINSEMSQKLLRRAAASDDAPPAQPKPAPAKPAPAKPQPPQAAQPSAAQMAQQQAQALAAQRQAQQEAERQAQALEAQRQAQLEAERQAQLEAERQAQLEAEQQAAADAAQQAAAPPPGTVIPDVVLIPGQKLYVRGTFFYEAQADTELAFGEGDLINVLAQDESGWWQGELNGAVGWFPANFTEAVPEGTVPEETGAEGDIPESVIDEAVAAAGTTGTLSHVTRAKGMKGRRAPTKAAKLGAGIRTWESTEESPGAVAAAESSGGDGGAAAAAPPPRASRVARASIMPVVTDELQAKLNRAAAAASGESGASQPAPAPKKVPPPVPGGRGAPPPRPQPPVARGGPPPGAGRAAGRAAPLPAQPGGPPRPKPQPQPPAKAQPPPAQPAAEEARGGLPFPVQLRSVQPAEQPTPAAPEPAKPALKPAGQRPAPPPKKTGPQPGAVPPAARPQSGTHQPQPDQQPAQAASPIPSSPPVAGPMGTPSDWPKGIPEFGAFCQELVAMLGSIRPASDSAPSPNVPSCGAGVSLAVCAMDGQTFTHGGVASSGDPVTAQGAIWPLLFATASAEDVSKYVGKDAKLPDGVATKAPNPWCPAGGIALSAVHCARGERRPAWERLAALAEQASGLAGRKLGFSMPAYLRAKDASEQQWATVYAMKAAGSLPDGVSAADAMHFFLQANSIEMPLAAAATYAAALANDGVCPATRKKVLPGGAKALWASLSALGLGHDQPQKLPSVGGESGLVLIVVPHVAGIAVYSHEISAAAGGCSAVGCEFLKQLSAKYRFK